MIRVRIAADSAVVRAGLEALAASSPDVQLVESDALRPDVVLASVPMEDAPTSGAAVVLLTGESWTTEALRAGVRAILPANASAAEILAAVDAAAAGLAAVDPRELDALLSAVPQAPVAADSPSLTARELEVLRMMADGAANKTIAWKLDISEHTAKFHVASILGKLGASTRTEAVTIGIRKGLVLL